MAGDPLSFDRMPPSVSQQPKWDTKRSVTAVVEPRAAVCFTKDWMQSGREGSPALSETD